MMMLQQMNGQIVDNPVLTFESLSWGEPWKDVRSSLPQAAFRALASERSAYFKEGDEHFFQTYTDSLEHERLLVGLQFTKRDSTLRSVMITYIGIDTATHKNFPDVDRRIASLWAGFSEHFGHHWEEKNLPFMGKVRQWSLQRSKVQAMNMTSISTLTVIISPK